MQNFDILIFLSDNDQRWTANLECPTPRRGKPGFKTDLIMTMKDDIRNTEFIAANLILNTIFIAPL